MPLILGNSNKIALKNRPILQISFVNQRQKDPNHLCFLERYFGSASIAGTTFVSNWFSCSVVSIRYDTRVCAQRGLQAGGVGQITSLVTPAVVCPSEATSI